ncbi:hypothetical protein IC582_018917 [Cucumis melo]|uniref:Uncharacterized protein LOC127150494 isoform X2 n=1 Tax=Cucumis melo TaxID=3656 RepID=A0ABM3L2M4_CUCME|nr:uncharacterized protein LOC127150494 isoform X2 [Cucumis melo]
MFPWASTAIFCQFSSLYYSPVGDGAGDGAVQLYWERILGRSLDLNGQVHQIALKAIVSLWVGAVISSWCNFIIVLYVGHFLLEEDDKFLDKV